MSDPPYYTACPNPWLADFVAYYGKPYDPEVKYSREPLAIDVSVSKTDQLYRAYSYHTKVPHLAIVPSILHYTQPGDIVLDGFAGSGMTGVAAQWCGSAPAAYRHEVEMSWKKEGPPTPKWGARRAILNDQSPAATFISANYNIPFDVEAFAKAGKKLLKNVEQKIGWMYETLHADGKTKGRITRIESQPVPSSFPTARFPIADMYHGSRIAPKDFTNVHHLFLPCAGQRYRPVVGEGKRSPQSPYPRLFALHGGAGDLVPLGAQSI